ncbi:MAG: DegQ family serine endoprotease [Paludibacterium sp.]|uniref:DegQ family serine endoprotease n=1 Tax=Paludibacterium sp. TaxID=1917523 RepID=UPI0025FC43C7|nr:DegQ family serine endoprotease [Paludibacterium sp.]MBV8049513.1 DegQ family serine endoprotease [Paludibacterium sp.]MBV8646226.1 DegQ family serine endoprotease [Paludibacterium sp.]
MTVRVRVLLAASLSLALLTGCDQVQKWFHKDEPLAPVVIPAQQDGKIGMLLPDFTQLVERDGPAVVNIQALRTGIAADDDSADAGTQDDPFFDFFKRFMPNPYDQGNDGQQQDQPQTDSISYGSGFIISQDGYIMTNAHVVQGGNPIKVVMTDKREFKARLVGLDKRTDVALLKVDGSNLPVVKVGDPDQLKPGEWVAAIGAPFGFENSVTAGIVSAKGRSLPDESYVPFIQTDVAINPGNSGGPLFNLRGEVVGINSQIYSRSGGFMGISFAIPINLAMNVADQIKMKGKVSRGQLGVSIQEVTQELAQSFGLSQPRGALVVRVDPQSAAARAGVQPGDIILQLDGRPIQSSKDLPQLVGNMKPGSQVKLRVWRKGGEVVLNVTLGELSNDTAAQPAAEPNQPQSYQFGKLGLIVSEIPPAQLAQIGLRGGLLVEKVKGLAARSGLMGGDVIIGVNQTEVTTIKGFEQALASSRGNIALLVRRMSDTLYIPLKLN